MSRPKYVLASNIFISIVKGLLGTAPAVELPLNGKMYISVITRIEALAFPRMIPAEEEKIRRLLRYMKIIPLNRKVEKTTIPFRAKTKIKLPDSIVAASAITINAILLSNDSDFRDLNFPGLTVKTCEAQAINPNPVEHSRTLL
jgi:predicted nucleic acid-binding protein